MDREKHRPFVLIAVLLLTGGMTVASAPISAASAAAFRGRVIDAVSQQPLQKFEVHLIRVRPDTGTTDQPVSRAFRSASGRFIWTALAEGTWHAAITAPGYQRGGHSQ